MKKNFKLQLFLNSKNLIQSFLYLTIFFIAHTYSIPTWADLITNRSNSNVLEANKTDWSLGIGNFCELIGRVQVDEKGNKNLCTYRPFVSSDFFLRTNHGLHYGLLLGSSFPQSPKDDYTHRMVIHFVPAARFFYEHFHFQLSLGLQFTRIWGDGGEVVLNNGSSTQTFNVPNESKFARNTILGFGIGYSLFDQLTLNSDLYALDLLDSDKRAYSLLLQMKYHFGEWL